MGSPSRSADSTALIGSVMVLVGLGFFVVVFVTVFPVLTNPAGAYDRWFPAEEAADTVVIVEPRDELDAGPRASFRWESVSVPAGGASLDRVRVNAETPAASTEIVDWLWEFGDGSTGRGASVVHDYEASGNYTVRLQVTDLDGAVDSVSGQVVVPGTGSAAGSVARIDELTALGSGANIDGIGEDLTSSLEDAVGSVGEDLNSTLDSALGSIGSAARGGVVVALFGLAALAATVVGWRTARIGVMLLTGSTGRSGTIVRRLEERREDRPDLEAVA